MTNYQAITGITEPETVARHRAALKAALQAGGRGDFDGFKRLAKVHRDLMFKNAPEVFAVAVACQTANE